MKDLIQVKGHSRTPSNHVNRLEKRIALLTSHEVAASRANRLNRTMTELLVCEVESVLAATDFTEVHHGS